MTRNYKILLSITWVGLLGALFSGIYLLVARNRVDGKDHIQITNVNSTLTNESNLGTISPGETKQQTYIIESLVDKDISVSLKFETSKVETAFSYIDLNASIEDETIISEKLSDSFNISYTYPKKIKKEESKKLVIKYTLNDDIPSEIVGASLDFSIVLQTNAFL